MKDLRARSADTAVGKAVDVIIIRKGKEETRKVTLGRLDDGEKPVEASIKTTPDAADKPVTQSALGLDLAALSKDLRTKYKIKDKVKGVVVVNVADNSDAADKRLSAGDVIVEVAQEAVINAAASRSASISSRRTARSRSCCWSRTAMANCGLSRWR